MTSLSIRTIVAGGLLLGAAALVGEEFLPQGHSIDGIEVADGLQATVFAESPMLTNPTNLDVDARGRVWVLEGYNYRNSLHPDQTPREEGDRVLILEDTDGDGKADSQKVFYQGRDVDAAMGIAVLGNQVIVSAYEHVYLLTDTDGDDRADQKEILYTLNKVDHDHTVHAFVFGPDGRLYFNAGDQGMFVKDPSGRTIVDVEGNEVTSEGKPYRKGMAFRVERDGSRFEVLGHNFRNPYEVAVDAYGTVWQSDNDDDGNRAVRINYVMPHGNYGYTDEFTGAGWRTPRSGMSDSIPLRHWHLSDPGVVPNVLQTGAGSPTGIMVYEGDLLPERFRNVMIHADAGPRVVRAYPVADDGAGYRGRIEPILTGGNDPLFRPSDVAAAPDGSLFVADWYDPGVGGHNVRDLTYGRILRVAPNVSSYQVSAPDLSRVEVAAQALSSPNQATRFLAYTQLQQLGAAAEPALRQVWTTGTSRQRARALWLLAALPDGSRYIDEAVAGTDADLRITGLRAAERVGMDVLPIARRLVRDPSPQVRREVALSLRHKSDAAATELWVELARQYDGSDRWYLEALGIAADGQWDTLLPAWRAAVGDQWDSKAGRDIVWRSRTDSALPVLADLIRAPSTQEADRQRYVRAFDFHQGPAREAALLGLLDPGSTPQGGEVAALALLHLDAEASGADPRVGPSLARTLDATRGTARFVELAARYEARDRVDELVALAVAESDNGVGVDAARLALGWEALGRFEAIIEGDDGVAAERAIDVLGSAGGAEPLAYLQRIAASAEQPLVRRRATIQAMGRGQAGERRILQMVTDGVVPEDLKPVAASILFASFRPAIREAAAQYLTPPAATTADGKILPAVAELSERRGDPVAGQAAFARTCAICHTAAGVGTEFGPGLSDIGGKLSRSALYTAILEPSAGVSFNYAGETIRLRDGSEVAAIVGSETASELTLRFAGGVTSRIASVDVVSRTPMDVSLMPDGLERTMTEQDLVDLVEYLVTLR